MDCCEALVACRYAAPAGRLQMLQKLSDVLSRKVIYLKLIHGLVRLASDKRDEQPQGIAITLLRIPRQIAFANQMLQEKTPHPRSEPGLSHDTPPAGHTAQTAPKLHGAVLESS